MTTETPTYAPEGNAFFSVDTPSFFREAMLPIDPAHDTSEQAQKRRELAEAAERHGTYVNRTEYRRG